jgi:hypothetical protein
MREKPQVFLEIVTKRSLVEAPNTINNPVPHKSFVKIKNSQIF